MTEATFEQLKDELLRDPEVKRAYEELGPEFEAEKAIINARLRSGGDHVQREEEEA